MNLTPISPSDLLGPRPPHKPPPTAKRQEVQTDDLSLGVGYLVVNYLCGNRNKKKTPHVGPNNMYVYIYILIYLYNWKLCILIFIDIDIDLNIQCIYYIYCLVGFSWMFLVNTSP